MSPQLEAILEAIRNKPARTRGRRVHMIDGKPHRLRRGVFVEIPAEWFGVVTHKQTIRKRASKQGQGASFKKAKP